MNTMTTDFWLAALHHAALLLMVGTLGAESALLRLPASAAIITRLGRLDLLYGISSGVLLLAGVSRLVWGAKGWAFYSGSPAFWVKMLLFLVVGLLSIPPTVRFIRWRKALAGDAQWLPGQAEWDSTRKFAFRQMHLLPFVALCAAAMARGIGA
jgi:putative membrane protein